MASAFARRLSSSLTPLRSLDGRLLDDALAAFIPCELGPGEVLMDPADSDHPVLMVASGELSMNIAGRTPLRLSTLRAGDVMGGSPLHGGGAPPVRVITESACQVLVLESEGVEWLQARSHPVLHALQRAAMATAVAALRGAERRLVQLARLPKEPLTAAPPSLLSRLTGRLGLPRSTPQRPELLLAGSRVFGHVDAVANGWLADRLRPVPLASRQVIQLERCETTGVWLVAEGMIELLRELAPGGPELLESLGPGSVIGLPGLIDGGPAAATAQARERSWVYHLDADTGAALLHEPEAEPLRRAILACLDERLRQVGIGLSELTLQARRGGISDQRMLRATAAALWGVRG